MCCNNGWGGNCLWIIILIIILFCCGGCGGGCGNGCGGGCGGCGGVFWLRQRLRLRLLISPPTSGGQTTLL